MNHTPPDTRSQVQEYLHSLKASPKFGPQVVCHRIFDEKPPLYGKTNNHFRDSLSTSLHALGIEALYTHQAEALNTLNSGKNVIVATPTSSGKSLVYNLPVLETIINKGDGHALYLFPLKALSQDQLKNLEKLASHIGAENIPFEGNIAAIYDGDTPAYTRRKIREKTPPIIITNPDMLHLSFLPFHENWSHFYKNLDYVIIDEVHTYRGIFGSHVSWVLKRLRRILRYYGKSTKFILSSATIGNPKIFGEKLIDEEIEVITSSGAPWSKRNFLFLNPWDSPAYTASQLLEAALKRGLRTIVYTQSRKMTELISLWTRSRLGELAPKLSSYRAGFLAEERREIEKGLSDGSLLGVISTSALELGIDIGDLDLCLLVGYPGSIMASWQRGGRVGRGGRESAVILIGSEDALDQYYMNNPDKFFTQEVESAVLNPDNIRIIKDHLVCAAAEIPLGNTESTIDKENVQQAITDLLGESKLLQSADGSEYYSSRKRPQRNVSLRGSGNTLTIINGENGLILGEIDAARALKECHEGAIYLHRVQTWLVEKLDLNDGEVVVRPNQGSYHTRPMSSKKTEILNRYQNREVFGCRLCFGHLKVTEQVTGYQKRNNGTNRLIASVPLDLPLQTMETEGVWLDIPASVVAKMQEGKHHFMGGLHAFEHVMISIFPLLVLCDRNDIGGISCPHHEQTEGATIFIYDGHAGGSGLSAEAYRKAEKLISKALEIVSSCDCENGCPSCVHSPKCGSGNRPIDKHSCIDLITYTMSGKKEGVADKRNRTETSSRNQDYLVGHKILQEIDNKKSGIALLPEHYGVFDLETQRSADEVGGWHRAEKMKISVGVVYDSLLDGYVTYLEDEVDQLIEHLASLDLVIGFNNKRFDNRVLAPYCKTNPADLPAIDLLEEIHRYLGYRLSLNSIALHTLGIEKSGTGLQALQWYRQKDFEKLSKYCRKDVEITKNLFIYCLENGFLLFANKAGKKVRLPLTLEKSISHLLPG